MKSLRPRFLIAVSSFAFSIAYRTERIRTRFQHFLFWTLMVLWLQATFLPSAVAAAGWVAVVDCAVRPVGPLPNDDGRRRRVLSGSRAGRYWVDALCASAVAKVLSEIGFPCRTALRSLLIRQIFVLMPKFCLVQIGFEYR